MFTVERSESVAEQMWCCDQSSGSSDEQREQNLPAVGLGVRSLTLLSFGFSFSIIVGSNFE